MNELKLKTKLLQSIARAADKRAMIYRICAACTDVGPLPFYRYAGLVIDKLMGRDALKGVETVQQGIALVRSKGYALWKEELIIKSLMMIFREYRELRELRMEPRRRVEEKVDCSHPHDRRYTVYNSYIDPADGRKRFPGVWCGDCQEWLFRAG